MSTLSWMSRVRAFFAGKHPPAPAVAAETAWSGGGGTLALVGTAVADEAPPTETAPPAAENRKPPPEPAPPPEPPPARPRRTPSPPSRIDPLDPPWLERLEALGAVGRELQGHRETGEALLRAVRQLPDLASDQTDHIVQTNRLLERQNVLLSSMLDALAGVGASMQTMEESGRRHLTAIGQLEASHRQVLYAYQEVLERTHRRLGRLATLATLLAAVAVGGVAWVLYLVLAGG
ncbi:MAG: hypothetical protein R6X20_08430 [Phycisphaerae bacterium]